MESNQETPDRAASQPLQEGMAVFDRDDEKLGTLKQHQPDNGRLLVHQGWLFGHDLSVPQSMVARVDATGIHLSVAKQEAEHPSTNTVEGGAGLSPAAQLERTAPIVPPKRLDADPLTAGVAGDTASTVPQATDPVADQAGSLTDQARQGVEQVAGQAAAAASQVAERVGHAAEQVQQAASELAANQLADAAERVARVAHALTQLGEQLRQSAQATLAEYATRAATQLDVLAARLREGDKGPGDPS